MGRGRKTHDEEKDIEKLLKMCSTYLVTNFHKFDPQKRFLLSKSLVEKRVPSLKDNEQQGDVFVYNDFRSKLRSVGADGIREVMGLLRARAGKV